MNNKKTLIITFLTILLLSTNAFILFLGSISRIVLANKTGFSSLICFKLKNLVFVKKILIFIGIFAIFYILFFFIKNTVIVLEKNNNTKKVIGVRTKKEENIYCWKYKEKTYTTGNFLNKPKYSKLPGKIELYIDPFYPFIWGLKPEVTIKQLEAKEKNKKYIHELVLIFVIIFIIILY